MWHFAKPIYFSGNIYELLLALDGVLLQSTISEYKLLGIITYPCSVYIYDFLFEFNFLFT